MQIVWFKRDLRIEDHEPLYRAALCGRVIPLYIVEPGLWQQPDTSGRHWAFVRECLISLREGLSRLGQPLAVRHGEAVEVLRALCTQHKVTASGLTRKRGMPGPTAATAQLPKCCGKAASPGTSHASMA